MEDLTPEQIIQMGQMYFPEMDAEKILDVFEQFKQALPKGTSNLEIAQVIKMAVDDTKSNKGTPQLEGLRQVMKNR